MSSSDTNQGLIASLNNISSLLNQYVSIIIYILGIVGNLINVLVLSHRTLRANPSAFCFLMTSIAGLVIILSGLTSRMMSGYGADLTLTIRWICKVRNVVLYGARTMMLWMIVLATVDRWLSSNLSVNRRQMSSLKNARRSMMIIFICTCALNTPIVFCYEANLSGALRGCYGSTYSCRVATDLIYAFGSTLLPLLLMISFGLLTIRNVRSIKNRVQAMRVAVLNGETISVPTNTRRQSRKTDRSLLKMLFVQVALLFLLTCPHAVQKVYSSFVSSPPSRSVENAVQTLLFNVLTLLAFTASGMPFYIYTLSGGIVFRNVLFDLVKRCLGQIFCC